MKFKQTFFVILIIIVLTITLIYDKQNFEFISKPFKNHDISSTLNETLSRPVYIPDVIYVAKESNTTSETTVVATYFQFKKSKHNHDLYKNWLKNMLESVSSPLVIYTDSYSKDFIYTHRSALGLPTKILVYNSIWDLMHELEVVRNKEYIKPYMERQHSK
jgi:hypothetical protein